MPSQNNQKRSNWPSKYGILDVAMFTGCGLMMAAVAASGPFSIPAGIIVSTLLADGLCSYVNSKERDKKLIQIADEKDKKKKDQYCDEYNALTETTKSSRTWLIRGLLHVAAFVTAIAIFPICPPLGIAAFAILSLGAIALVFKNPLLNLWDSFKAKTRGDKGEAFRPDTRGNDSGRGNGFELPRKHLLERGGPGGDGPSLGLDELDDLSASSSDDDESEYSSSPSL